MKLAVLITTTVFACSCNERAKAGDTDVDSLKAYSAQMRGEEKCYRGTLESINETQIDDGEGGKVTIMSGTLKTGTGVISLVGAVQNESKRAIGSEATFCGHSGILGDSVTGRFKD